MTINDRSFTLSDTVSGYVTHYDPGYDAFHVRTPSGREYRIHLTKTTSASMVRNLQQPYADVTGEVRNMLTPERYVSVACIFYPEDGGDHVECSAITFFGEGHDDFMFEHRGWWADQVRQVADFYLQAQFPETLDGKPANWRNFRTHITLAGYHISAEKKPDFRQETDSISRLVYGLASAYLLTGEDRFIEAAQSGTEYLREHMSVRLDDEEVTYWYHGIDVSGDHERKIYASEFGDDFEAVPAYEQIYALAGLTQTYRVTGDPRIMEDIDRTIRLFEKYYRDDEKGGYFSHLDPVTLDPRADSLGKNRARKNWNSVGDHAPAYLINALIATDRDDMREMLKRCADSIVEHFPRDDSPFVQERFWEDWQPDTTWGWQQNNAVVGHNLKIAWNLMRVHNARPNDSYVELAERLATTMPDIGSDRQRGGWYDVLERHQAEGHSWHRFVWHDRKAWWQQEQAILAYLILAGSLDKEEYRWLARESAAFYNAFFLDHDDGGVYFNVLASGVPYLVGTERLKGSHAMAGYHATELCYLAAVYTQLLIIDEPLHLHFRPRADGFPDRVLRVAPDLLPPDSQRLTDVWVDGKPLEGTAFDEQAMSVKLPDVQHEMKVSVRIAPAYEVFDCRYESSDSVVTLTCWGQLTGEAVDQFKRRMERAVNDKPRRLVLSFRDLTELSQEGLNDLLFQGSKVGVEQEIYIVGAKPGIEEMIKNSSDAFKLVADESALPSMPSAKRPEPAS